MKKFNSEMEHPEKGVSSLIASGLVMGLYYFLTLGLLNFAIAFYNNSFKYSKIGLILLALPSLILFCFFVLKEKKYLKYFVEFREYSKINILSFFYFLFAVAMILTVILSFVYRNSINN